MIGYDYRLNGNTEENKGKRFHMREIRKFYDVKFNEMILFDDTRHNLENEDGWIGIRTKTNPEVGCFSFLDLHNFLSGLV
mmetsp:Transcript_70021/g.105854  ORF Transcript_70021/g.105854 Transcript_70021/m.105854 type:complete len:80 (+) Transcript_70021:152-391(+)